MTTTYGSRPNCARLTISTGNVINTGPKKGISWLSPKDTPNRTGLFNPRAQNIKLPVTATTKTSMNFALK